MFTVFGRGATLANIGPSPMIDWSYDQADGFLIIGLDGTGTVTNGGTPVLNVTPGGAYTSSVFFYGLSGEIGRNTIQGSNGAGTALVGFLVSPSFVVALDQPSWAGAPLTSLYDVGGRPRWNIQTDPLTVPGPYVMGGTPTSPFGGDLGENGSEFVRVSPDTSPVGVQLPDPRACKGQKFPIKEVSGVPAFNTEITTLSGLIDGSPGPYVILPTAYFVVWFMSDGVNWWRV